MQFASIFADPPPFGTVDSPAYWVEPGTGDLRRCTIKEPYRNGSFLISVEGGNRRIATRDELADPAHVKLKPFGRWTMERVAREPHWRAPGEHGFTDTRTLYEDYLAWLIANDLDARVTIDAFDAMMQRNGFTPMTRVVQRYYSRVPQHENGFLCTLRKAA